MKPELIPYNFDHPGPILLKRVKVDVLMYPDDIGREWSRWFEDLAAAAAERRALRQLPKRLVRHGRKHLRARMIRNGHYKHPANTNPIRITWARKGHIRTYPYPRNR